MLGLSVLLGNGVWADAGEGATSKTTAAAAALAHLASARCRFHGTRGASLAVGAGTQEIRRAESNPLIARVNPVGVIIEFEPRRDDPIGVPAVGAVRVPIHPDQADAQQR